MRRLIRATRAVKLPSVRFIRCNSSLSEGKNAQEDQSSFTESSLTERYFSIISKIEQRQMMYENELSTDRKISFRNVHIKSESNLSGDFVHQVPEIGHLVELLGSEPAVVVELASEQDPENYTLYMSSGRLKQVPKKNILFSLGPFVPKSLFKDAVRTVNLNGEECKQLVHPVQRSLYLPLRRFIEISYRSLAQAGAALSDIMRSIQQPTQSVNVPFFDLVREIEMRIITRDDSPDEQSDVLSGVFPAPVSDVAVEVPASTVHIVYYALSQNFSTCTLIKTDPFIVTFLPRRLLEQRSTASKRMNKSNADVSQLIKSYALDDISLDDSDSAASAILAIRSSSKKFNGGVVEPESALKMLSASGLLDERVGPFFDKQQYAFLKNTQLAPSFAKDGSELPDRLEKVRKDFGSTPVYCIDSDKAEEIDDGISVSFTNSTAHVSVHIADPMSLFRNLDSDPNVEILRKAYRQTSTAYFPTTSIPMLPREFSDICGLTGKTGKRTLRISFDYDLQKKKVVNGSQNVSVSYVQNIVPLTYEQVDDIISSKGHNSESKQLLTALSDIAEVLNAKRLSHGAMEIQPFRKNLSVDESGNIELSENKHSNAQKLVSEMMIKANVIMAEFLGKNGLSGIYRSQDLDFDSAIEKRQFENILKSYPSLKNSPQNIAIQAIRYMRPVQLSTVGKRHVGLGLPLYCHATSPLRRFQDMLLHWQAESFLLDGKASKHLIPSESMSIMARRIESYQRLIKFAQNDSATYWILKAIQKKLISSGKPLSVSAISYAPFVNIDGFQPVFLPQWGIQGKVYVDPMLHSKPFDVGAKLECMIKSIEPLSLSIILVP